MAERKKLYTEVSRPGTPSPRHSPRPAELYRAPDPQKHTHTHTPQVLNKMKAEDATWKNFYSPVVELAPHLAKDYLTKVREPMDFRTMQERVDAGVR